MIDTNLLETLASYVPAMLVRRLATNPNPPETPDGELMPAAVLFADISGFTPLAAHLAQNGPAGVEELTRILNTYFDQLISLVTALGGDVIKFAGDAVLALWPAIDEDLPTVTRRAAQCSLSLQMLLHNYEAMADLRLSIRIGIGAGQVLTASVGGMLGRWEFLAAGHPLVQIGAANAQAQPGQVILSPEAYDLIASQCLGERLPSGALRLEDIRAPLPLREPVALKLTTEMEAALCAYIPGAILTRLTARQTSWLAEFRRVSVLFLNVTGLDHTAPDALDHLHIVMQTLQSILYRYEGSVNQFIMDDKGINLVAALGLPPLTHEDDAVRALQAALGMQGGLRPLGLASAIGVTTGLVFCGGRGNSQRRDYAMIGDTINMAARLMQAASGHTQPTSDNHPIGDNILCDTTTYELARARIDFDGLPSIKVKGKTEPIRVYRPLGEKRVIHTLSQTSMVDRAAERSVLANSLQKLVRGANQEHNAVLILIEGEAGIGKSRLIDDLRRQAEAMQIGIFTGAGDAIEKSTSYNAWRGVFSQMFDLSLMANPAAQRQHFLDLIEDEPELLQQAPLLNPILPFTLPDNDLIAPMSGQMKADSTRHLLIQLLQNSVNRSSKIIILEDAHWLDSASWGLAQAVSQHVRPLMLVIAHRSMPEPRPVEYVRFLRAIEKMPPSLTFHHLHLNTLTHDESMTLACQRLGVAHLPEPVADLIYQKADGNPFFTEELTYTLRDSGLIRLLPAHAADPTTRPVRLALGQPAAWQHHTGDARTAWPEANQAQPITQPDVSPPPLTGLPHVCQIAPGVDLKTVSLPDTVQGLITSRIDRLTPSQQFTIKVASVIGRLFAFRLLYDIYPIEADKVHLSDNLSSLERLDFVILDTVEPEPIYAFKHIIMQEVVYDMMLFSQRRQLHQAIAEWYEHSYADDLSPYYSLLAHHYRYAEATQQERLYARLAGQQAAARFANAEALLYLNRAMDLTPGDNHRDIYEILLTREKIYDLQAAREAQRQDLDRLQELVKLLSGDSSYMGYGPRAAQQWAEVALRQAHYYGATCDYPAAIAAAKMIIDLARLVNDVTHTSLDSEAAGHLEWGAALWRQGDYPGAQARLELALRLAQEKNLSQVEADSRQHLACVLYSMGYYAEADDHTQTALELYRRIGDRRGESTTLGHLGNLLRQKPGGAAEARLHYEQALKTKQEIGDIQGEGFILSGLARLCREQGHYDLALAYYTRSIHIRQQIADRHGEGIALRGLANLYDEQGDYSVARAYFERSLLTRQGIYDRRGEGVVLAHMSLHFHHSGDNEEARGYGQRALHIARELNDRDTQAYALTHLGHALTELGRAAEAEEAYQVGLALRRELGQAHLATEPMAGLARLALTQGQIAPALAQAEAIERFCQSSSQSDPTQDDDPLTGTCEPLRVYLTCYHALQTTQPARALVILNTAYRLLQARAAAISDEHLQQSFLENVAVHRAILYEWQTRNP